VVYLVNCTLLQLLHSYPLSYQFRVWV